MTEYIDIYDENRQPTGRTVERGTKLGEGEFMLYITALIEDLDGHLLITQRSLDKSWGAGWWEVTGGGVPAGETSEVAVVREVAEEVGLDISGLGTPVPVYSYRNIDLERGDNYFMDIYHFRFDFTKEDVVLQAEEAIDCALVTWDDIVALNEKGEFLHFKRLEQALAAEKAL